MKPFSLLPLIALVACTSEPAMPQQQLVEQAEPSAVETIRPRLPVSVGEALTILAGLAAAWDQSRFVTPMDAREDSFSGTTKKSGLTPDGAVEIYVRPDEGIWKVAAQSGVGDRCGRSWSQPALVKDFVKRIAGQVLSANQVSSIVDSMKRKEIIEPIDIGGVRVNGAGGCVQVLSVKAITEGVDGKEGAS